MGKRILWTPAEDQTLRDIAAAGATTSRAVDLLSGRTLPAVLQRAGLLGVRFRGRPYQYQKREMMFPADPLVCEVAVPFHQGGWM